MLFLVVSNCYLFFNVFVCIVVRCCFVLCLAATRCVLLLRVGYSCFVLCVAVSCCILLVIDVSCRFVLLRAVSCFLLVPVGSCCVLLFRVASS